MKVPFVALAKQHKVFKSEILSMISHALDEAAFIGGENVAKFEEEFAEFCNTSHCVGVSSGTDALRFALIAVGIGAGDEVITVPNTFIATTEAITQVGARPVFVDIDPVTYNMDVSQLEGVVTDKTRAILPVHLYGQAADMDPIMELARKFNLSVIEDACQAHGALYKGNSCGSMADAGCFSFYPGKNLGACGEGGAVVTDNAELAGSVRMLRNHGQKEKYIHEIEGYNGRLDAIQAGILRIKLKQLKDWNDARIGIAACYQRLLSDIPFIRLPQEATYATRCVYHLYVVLAEKRDELRQYLYAKGIETGLHYPVPLHLQKAYEHLGYKKGDFPVAEQVAEKLLSLPIYPEMTEAQVEYVADSIKSFYTLSKNGKI